jgi:hypothetical protein
MNQSADQASDAEWEARVFVGHGFSRDINASLGPALAADAFVGVPKLQGLKPNYSSRYCRS